MWIKLTSSKINRDEALNSVRHPRCGAVVTFEGTVRGVDEGRPVLALEYEVYEPLFRHELRKIFAEIRKRWGIDRFALIQRIGKLEVGEAGLFIAIASPHRSEALEALSYAIESFKQRAPVWKKEWTEPEGARWVHCEHLTTTDR
ncbi:MAG: molybdenum cofactor biosynthesis protein MoaE [Deltaproteobacteria bacterium]|nr:molybdenum cofactor biosynthesis protein MoaE [Deltaproteobacteria bacterium]